MTTTALLESSSSGSRAAREGSYARLSVMNFLNEVAERYPSAISFASGRPADGFFELDAWLGGIPRLIEHLAVRDGRDADAVARQIAQYGRTNGFINDLVAAQLASDEGIHADAGRIIVTAGCQEALSLCISALCTERQDVVLSRNPTYIGVTGAATLAGIDQVVVPGGISECAAAVAQTVEMLKRHGKRPRALYLTPSFDNPTGATMSAEERIAVLDVCYEHRIVVLEDNPYGMFGFEKAAPPNMAELDRRGVVIYLGTYSKSLCPSVRVGCLVVPQTLFGDEDASRELVEGLGMRKSFATVNTSQLNQALVGGVLLAEGRSLKRMVEPVRKHYWRNRDLLLKCLGEAFSDDCGVRWNRPDGGFFLSVQMPFAFGQAEVERCASEFGVIPMPMSYFALDSTQNASVRMAFSNVSDEQIIHGVDRFSRFVHGRLARRPVGA
ncbi:PLP-dependent aminotransferase family protein [Lysobacter sp. ESA13C]|uniref:aminotransferase-like domain-containing protein n=1 Tax=Lysobacter sp. ESA13C TaxID=2862676 RepID=UPI001CC0B542|nr:PLP-dependent aminotransferase family protein [Lysobacter sp. ESA13C]